MKKILVLMMTLSVLACGSVWTGAETTAADKEAIRIAALDYIEGWFEGNVERMDRALHPDLAKRSLRPEGEKTVVLSLTKPQMLDYTRQGGGKRVPAEKRAIQVSILDVYRDMANVRVDCVNFIDYLQLIRLDGRWQIINVLWLPNIKDRKEIAVDPAIFGAFTGEYELRPGFIITVTTEGGRLYSQATGQPRVEIFPESETKYFLKVTDAQITFVKDAQGTVAQLMLHQGGMDIPAKKIK